MNATESQKTKLNRMLLKGEPMDTSILAGIADYEGAVEQAITQAQSMLKGAVQDLNILPPSPSASPWSKSPHSCTISSTTAACRSDLTLRMTNRILDIPEDDRPRERPPTVGTRRSIRRRTDRPLHQYRRKG
jgi:hypothetical protein